MVAAAERRKYTVARSSYHTFAKSFYERNKKYRSFYVSYQIGNEIFQQNEHFQGAYFWEVGFFCYFYPVLLNKLLLPITGNNATSLGPILSLQTLIKPSGLLTLGPTVVPFRGVKGFSGGSGIRTLAAWRLLFLIHNPTAAGRGHFELLNFPPKLQK